MAVNNIMGQHIFEAAQREAWTFGPVPETGPPELDTGEEILMCLARLAYLIPMQQHRLNMMEISELTRGEQRRWLRGLKELVDSQGMQAGYHQHNLRKAGYSNKAITP